MSEQIPQVAVEAAARRRFDNGHGNPDGESWEDIPELEKRMHRSEVLPFLRAALPSLTESLRRELEGERNSAAENEKALEDDRTYWMDASEVWEKRAEAAEGKLKELRGTASEIVKRMRGHSKRLESEQGQTAHRLNLRFLADELAALLDQPPQEEADPDPYFGTLTGRECAACGVDEKVGDEGWESNEQDAWCANCWVEEPPQPPSQEEPEGDGFSFVPLTAGWGGDANGGLQFITVKVTDPEANGEIVRLIPEQPSLGREEQPPTTRSMLEDRGIVKPAEQPDDDQVTVTLSRDEADKLKGIGAPITEETPCSCGAIQPCHSCPVRDSATAKVRAALSITKNPEEGS